MKKTTNSTLRGLLCAAAGGVCWGFSGTCGQYLFSNYSIDSLWLTCIRLLTGGVLLTLMSIPSGRETFRALPRSPRDLAQLVCYGIGGLMLCQYAYMTAISCSNAATATVLQNLGVVLIMLWSCLRQHRRPNRAEAAALVLALAGVYLLATGGNPTQMTISPQGLFWGLAAALALMAYNLLPQPLLKRWDRGAITGLAMLIGGLVLNLAARSWTLSVSLPPRGWLAVAGVILFGTVLAFSLIMQGIVEVGPVKASLAAATEPVSATIFSALWLKTPFSATDFLGFAAILATIFLLAKKE